MAEDPAKHSSLAVATGRGSPKGGSPAIRSVLYESFGVTEYVMKCGLVLAHQDHQDHQDHQEGSRAPHGTK
jgi:hypothetical protein